LRDDIEEIHEAGAELVVIGNGTPQQAQWFVEDTGLSTPVFTDPSLRIHELLGTRRGLSGVLDPRVFVRAFRALLRGFRQSGVQGDATQLGGVFVIDPGGEPLYAYRSRFAGDLPPSTEWKDQLRGGRS
jgi:hypothetical protein